MRLVLLGLPSSQTMSLRKPPLKSPWSVLNNTLTPLLKQTTPYRDIQLPVLWKPNVLRLTELSYRLIFIILDVAFLKPISVVYFFECLHLSRILFMFATIDLAIPNFLGILGV